MQSLRNFRFNNTSEHASFFKTVFSHKYHCVTVKIQHDTSMSLTVINDYHFTTDL
jgi:hypothetical protein